MTFGDWVADTHERIQEEGVDGVKDSGYELYLGMWRRVGRNVYNYGSPIWDPDWDVMLVLDACRFDLMCEVAEEYDFLETLQPRNSIASTSPEWMDKNFSEEHHDALSEVAYVTGNLFSQEHLDEDDFYMVDEVWDYGWDDDLGTIPADSITDRAVDVWRSDSPPQMLVHYMQPHHPFVPDPIGHGMGPIGEYQPDVWDILRKNDEITRDRVWKNYRDNLRYVLDSVSVFLQNIDADTVVITADHGNFIGEYGLYGHPGHVPLPPVKQVPWVETAASNTGGYQPELEPSSDVDYDVEDRLEALGYT